MARKRGKKRVGKRKVDIRTRRARRRIHSRHAKASIRHNKSSVKPKKVQKKVRFPSWISRKRREARKVRVPAPTSKPRIKVHRGLRLKSRKVKSRQTSEKTLKVFKTLFVAFFLLGALMAIYFFFQQDWLLFVPSVLVMLISFIADLKIARKVKLRKEKKKGKLKNVEVALAFFGSALVIISSLVGLLELFYAYRYGYFVGLIKGEFELEILSLITSLSGYELPALFITKFIGLVFGLYMLIAAFKLEKEKSRVRGRKMLTFFSVLSLLVFEGFLIGPVLGLVGSSVSLQREVKKVGKKKIKKEGKGLFALFKKKGVKIPTCILKVYR